MVPSYACNFTVCICYAQTYTVTWHFDIIWNLSIWFMDKLHLVLRHILWVTTVCISPSLTMSYWKIKCWHNVKSVILIFEQVKSCYMRDFAFICQFYSLYLNNWHLASGISHLALWYCNMTCWHNMKSITFILRLVKSVTLTIYMNDFILILMFVSVMSQLTLPYSKITWWHDMISVILVPGKVKSNIFTYFLCNLSIMHFVSEMSKLAFGICHVLWHGFVKVTFWHNIKSVILILGLAKSDILQLSFQYVDILWHLSFFHIKLVTVIVAVY